MTTTRRLPEWFKTRVYSGENYRLVRGQLDSRGLHTVCRGARCPNIWECWNSGTATFMLLGDRCTRNCTFCGVPGLKTPAPPDPLECERVAAAVEELGLAWAVLTSVTRDDLPDYGAGHFAACVKAIHLKCPRTGVELLIPDFKADCQALELVARCGARVLAHNVETVPGLYPRVRPEADYELSLSVLRFLAGRAMRYGYTVKSSLLVGLGESPDELRRVFEDLSACGCSSVTLGQYLPPSKKHFPVQRFYSPAEFDSLAGLAKAAGLCQVAAGPLVRSSYHAHELAGSGLHEPGPRRA